MKNKNSLEIMEMDMHTVVSQRPRLSPTLFENYRGVAGFKADFHRVYIKARKDLDEIWYPLTYLVTKLDIM